MRSHNELELDLCHVRKRQRLTETAKRQQKNGNGMVETGHHSHVRQTTATSRDTAVEPTLYNTCIGLLNGHTDAVV